MRYYVNINALNDCGNGSETAPFKFIQQAAEIAMPGDEVLVFPGIYRENVNPVHAGTADKRICYTAVGDSGVVITGSEAVTGWTKLTGTESVWKVSVPNSMFTERNPFTTLISGDWYMASFKAHTGDVFLNGKSMYEVTELKDVLNPLCSATSWDSDFSVYTWYTEQNAETDETVIYANFHALNPAEESVEISCRKSCFCPQKKGIGYITVSGFKICNAATQWAPPTAYQEGMIGPHWSKGWIIEDCEIFESKCSGISLGKYFQPNNDNKWLNWKYKDGTQNERDCICQAVNEGWSKERIGSHVIRRCKIHHCGQAGIVGRLGGVFSVIENNHIWAINNKQNLAGAEIGGIKMHAAIDTIIRRNHIHHCSRGLWLDWQAQGTRVTGNLFHDNALINVTDDTPPDSPAFTTLGEDVFIEVSHGPTLIDNNIFLSDRAMKICAQGIAIVNNLIAGSLVSIGSGTDNGSITLASPRYTPYHVIHGTAIAGFMTFLHGDVRFYNNIFLQRPVRKAMERKMQALAEHPDSWDDGNIIVRTHPYDGYLTRKEWEKLFEGYCGMGAEPSDRYYVHLPVYMSGNAYLNGAHRWEKEVIFEENSAEKIYAEVEEVDGKWYLRTNLYQFLSGLYYPIQDTDSLGMAFEPEEKFESPDGSGLTIDSDLFGAKRKGGQTIPGPFSDPAEITEALPFQ